MLRLFWAASVRTRHLLRRHMPTDILLELIRTRRGLEWGMPAMLLAAPYLLTGASAPTSSHMGPRMAQPPRAPVHLERA